MHHCILDFKYCRSLERHVSMSLECAWFWTHKLINIWPLSLHWRGHYQERSVVHKTPMSSPGESCYLLCGNMASCAEEGSHRPTKTNKDLGQVTNLSLFPTEWFIVCEILNKHWKTLWFYVSDINSSPSLASHHCLTGLQIWAWLQEVIREGGKGTGRLLAPGQNSKSSRWEKEVACQNQEKLLRFSSILSGSAGNQCHSLPQQKEKQRGEKSKIRHRCFVKDQLQCLSCLNSSM